MVSGTLFNRDRFKLGLIFMKTQEPEHQSIAGVTPPSTAEVPVMTAAFGWRHKSGQFLGRLYGIQTGFGIVRVGRLALLMTMPIGLYVVSKHEASMGNLQIPNHEQAGYGK